VRGMLLVICELHFESWRHVATYGLSSRKFTNAAWACCCSMHIARNVPSTSTNRINKEFLDTH
jgi:hypothetical protein